MEYKKQTLGGYNLHLIKTDKFKNCHVEVIFRNNVNPLEITKRQFLTNILCESNAEYSTRRKLLLKFEDLYNAGIYGFSSRVGGSMITSICTDFLNPEYTDKEAPRKTIELLFDLIFNPLVNVREFDNKTFELIKSNVADVLNSSKENPQKLAILNALKALGDTPSACSSFGTMEDLENITPENLYEYYEKMLKSDYVDIFVVGAIDMDEMAEIIDKYAKFKVIKNHPVKMMFKNPQIKEKHITKDFKGVQSNVVMVLNLNNLTAYEERYVANLYNTILGGSSLQSKLFKRLRSENSLCYRVQSFYQKYDSLILITTGVDVNSSDQAIKLIKDEIKNMTKNITDGELDEAKELVITSLNGVRDDINKVVDNYYYMSLGELDDLDTRINTFKNVSKEDIYALGKKISISVIYTLRGVEDE
jgi:predicted Zn-dependent peptidase